MLDSITKRRIDDARDILVGKIPDPKSQVEQITIALIYKFMDDMDSESEELGGESKFFTGEYQKYSWRRVFDKSRGGHEILISDIADNIYISIINALNALTFSINSNNGAMVILDDHLIQNISSFINEYYKNDEIKSAIKERIRFSSISINITQLSINSRHFMPGLMSLQNALR